MDLRSRRAFLKSGLAAGLGATIHTSRLSAARVDLTGLSLRQASEALRRKTVSSRELTEACLDRIARLNPTLNAFITITRDQALAAAREMDQEQGVGKWRGPLHGIPIALKDNIDTAGTPTTGASELFKDRIPTEDAEVVRRLKAAGAVLLGKLNLTEFAYGGSSAVTAFGTAHNPWSLQHSPGGSSSGPGIAIAASLCYGTLGTDTAGSIRIPASYCAVVGIKPTFGRASMRGIIPLSWSLDHVGPLAKTVEDAAILLGVIAGFDLRDPATIDLPVPDYVRALKTRVSRLRIGIPRTPFFNNVDPEVAKATEAAIDVLAKLTAGARDVQLTPPVNGASVYGPEAYAYHAQWITKTPEKYQPATRRVILAAAENKADAYAASLRQLNLVRREIRKTFDDVDVLVTPTMTAPPGLIQDPNVPPAPPTSAPRGGNNAQAFDAYGLPAISLPSGFTQSGLPIGLQIVGAPFAESTVFALAHAYEQATDWHTRRPSL